MEIERGGSVELRGGETAFNGGEPDEGNGCRILPTLGDGVELDGETALALLSLRLRYSATLSWKCVLIGENCPGETLLKSSADLDQALREMLRRSPSPLFFGVVGLELGSWNRETSTDP